MSLGLAVTLPDGVVLIADGRQIKPLAKTAETRNCVDKIQPIGPSAFAIPFGITQATDRALQVLLEKWSPDAEPGTIAHLVDSCVASSWAFLQTQFAPDVDREHKSMRSALIVGGLSKGRNFVVASLHGSGVQQEPVILSNSALQFILLGGEEHQSEAYFRRELEVKLADVASYDFSAGPVNELVGAVIAAGESVVRRMESLDSSIGGKIRFAVLRSGFPSLKGIKDGRNEIVTKP